MGAALGPRLATRANGLSALRLAAAPAVACAICAGAPHAAAALFALAVATDLLDGRVARRFGEATPLGGLLDHASDAVFVALGLGALAVRGDVPAALPALVAAAFVQYVLDSRALAGRRLRTSRLGRWNGILYFALLGTPIVRDTLALTWPSTPTVRAFGWLLIATTIASMIERAAAFLRPPQPPQH